MSDMVAIIAGSLIGFALAALAISVFLRSMSAELKRGREQQIAEWEAFNAELRRKLEHYK